MSEKSESIRDGSTLVKNSGRSSGSLKGDAVLEDLVIDYKEYAKSFSVSIENFAKLQTDAWKNGKRTGVFKLILGGKLRCWVVPEEIIPEYLNYKKFWDAALTKHPDLIEDWRALYE